MCVYTGGNLCLSVYLNVLVLIIILLPKVCVTAGKGWVEIFLRYTNTKKVMSELIRLGTLITVLFY